MKDLWPRWAHAQGRTYLTQSPEVGTHPQCCDSVQAQTSSGICPEHSKQDGIQT